MTSRGLLFLFLLAGCGAGVEPTLPPDLAAYRAAYEERWGPVDLRGWTIELRDTRIEWNGGSYGGQTWYEERHIIIGPNHAVFPHELHHVALGYDSNGHTGWCPFGQWEIDDLGFNEMEYLKCTSP